MKKIVLLIAMMGMAIMGVNAQNWDATQGTDKFGDPDGKNRVGHAAEGEFTNSLGSINKLYVFVIIQKEIIFLAFKEYNGMYDAEFSVHSKPYLHMKLGDNTIISIPGMETSNGRFLIDKDKEDEFIELLKKQSKIKCSFDCNNKYIFTINCVGFTKAYNIAFPDGRD